MSATVNLHRPTRVKIRDYPDSVYPFTQFQFEADGADVSIMLPFGDLDIIRLALAVYDSQSAEVKAA